MLFVLPVLQAQTMLHCRAMAQPQELAMWTQQGSATGQNELSISVAQQNKKQRQEEAQKLRVQNKTMTTKDSGPRKGHKRPVRYSYLSILCSYSSVFQLCSLNSVVILCSLNCCLQAPKTKRQQKTSTKGVRRILQSVSDGEDGIDATAQDAAGASARTSTGRKRHVPRKLRD